MVKISPQEFSVFTKYIHSISGIALDKGKEYLVETRLNTLLEKEKCSNYAELYHKAKTDPTKVIEKSIINYISTNETYFFRDASPFELLQYKIMPDLIDKKMAQRRGNMPIYIKIWSAACSTGQEVYSIAIVLKELLANVKDISIQLLGTDISDAAIVQASYGKYNKFEIARGLNQAKINKYFTPHEEGWRIRDEIRAMAVFRKINLMEPFVGMGKFDIVFFRNVAIYFTPPDRNKLYAKISQVLDPTGYLLIGSTESLAHDTDLFEPKKYLRAVFYQPKS